MRNKILAAAAAAILVSGTALAQGRGGPPGGGPPGGGMGGGAGGGMGGGVGGGRGAGPPITPPGQMGGGMATSDAARGLGAERGQFGRDFAAERRLTPEQRQERAEQFRARGQEQRAEALALAATLANAERRGQKVPADAAKRIRDALRADMQEWRSAFQVDRREWQEMRDQWLVDRDTLTAAQ